MHKLQIFKYFLHRFISAFLKKYNTFTDYKLNQFKLNLRLFEHKI